MPAVNNLIYNQSNITSWEAELTPLREQINANLQAIKQHNQALIPLQSQLENLQLQINSVETQLYIENLRNTQDWHYHQHDSHHHHHQTTNFSHTVGDMLSVANTFSLNWQLSDLRLQYSQLENQIHPHRQNIAQANEMIQRAKARIQWIEKHVAEGELFLKKLNEKPADLLNELRDHLLQTFADYQDRHPLGRSPQVRICLFNIQEKLIELGQPLVDTDMLYPSYNIIFYPSNKLDQINYLRFCAFLWEMYHQVIREGRDEHFANLLQHLLEKTHIPEHGDLPDNLQTGNSADFYFLGIKNKNPALFAMTEQDLLLREPQIFSDELDLIQPFFQRQNVLQTQIETATYLIQAEINTKLQKNEEVDYHFYIHAMRGLNQALRTPYVKRVAERIGELAEVASGAPSLGKKVLGGFIVVLGILVIGGSLAGLAATCGGSSLLTAYGIGIGLSLIETQIGLAFGFSLTAVLGVGLTLFGSHVVKAGVRQGVSKALKDVQGELDEHYNSKTEYESALHHPPTTSYEMAF